MQKETSWLEKAFSYCRLRSKLPDDIIYWTLLAYCGAALQDRMYINWAPKPVFPNLPLLIVTPSGRGKTGAINTIAPLFKDVLPYKIPEDSTAEAAIRSLALNGKTRFRNTCGLWVVPELADVFGRKDYQQGLIARITRLLDAPKDREVGRMNETARIKIEGYAVLNWIAGTTSEWLSKHVEDAVSSGGFLPRLFVVYSNEIAKWVPNPERDLQEERQLNKELKNLLYPLDKSEQEIVRLSEEWQGVSQKVYSETSTNLDKTRDVFLARREENILRLWLIFSIFCVPHSLEEAQKLTLDAENAGVTLAEDLEFSISPLLQRITTILMGYPSGISFAELCRKSRLSPDKVLATLRNLKAMASIQWDGGVGETSIIKRKSE